MCFIESGGIPCWANQRAHAAARPSIHDGARHRTTAVRRHLSFAFRGDKTSPGVGLLERLALGAANPALEIVKWLTSTSRGLSGSTVFSPTTFRVSDASPVLWLTFTWQAYDPPTTTVVNEHGGVNDPTPLAASTLTVSNDVLGLSLISMVLVWPSEMTLNVAPIALCVGGVAHATPARKTEILTATFNRFGARILVPLSWFAIIIGQLPSSTALWRASPARCTRLFPWKTGILTPSNHPPQIRDSQKLK